MAEFLSRVLAGEKDVACLQSSTLDPIHMHHPTVIFLMGPTASGKTGIALELAAQFPIEIVSVDSAMVYRGLNIGTGKPEPSVLNEIPHHLIDICDPSEVYSAKQFCIDALKACESILARHKMPVFVGGTHLYFKALWHGLSDLPSKDEVIRARLESEVQDKGIATLHARLQQCDPIAAAKINPNDPQRIIRALEVIELEGKPLSELWQTQNKPAFPYQVRAFALMPETRAILHERIFQRFQHMMAQGFEGEAHALYQRGDLSLDLPAIRSVGYRQMWDYFNGAYDAKTRDEKIVFATRQLAKRQLTWLRSWPEVSVIFDKTPIISALNALTFSDNSD